MSQVTEITYSMENIASVLNKEVSFIKRNSISEDIKVEKQITIIDLVFGNFRELREKLSEIQKFSKEVEHPMTVHKTQVFARASELQGEAKRVAEEIDKAIKRCRTMAQNLEDDLTTISIGTLKLFNLRHQNDVQYVIQELEAKKSVIEHDFLTPAKIDQPLYMRVPDLIEAFKDGKNGATAEESSEESS